MTYKRLLRHTEERDLCPVGSQGKPPSSGMRQSGYCGSILKDLSKREPSSLNEKRNNEVRHRTAAVAVKEEVTSVSQDVAGRGWTGMPFCLE